MSSPKFMSESVYALLLKQIGNEFGSQNLYLTCASIFRQHGLYNLAAFLIKRSEEERKHAMKVFEHLKEANYYIPIDSVPTFVTAGMDKSRLLDIARTVFEHEHDVSQRWLDIELASREEPYTNMFAQDFVDEQVEEEEWAYQLYRRIELAVDGPSLLTVDGQYKE